MTTTGSRVFTPHRPIKEHLLRGSGGIQAEIQDLRRDLVSTFCTYEGQQLAPYYEDTVDPTVTDDNTSGLVVGGFTRWARWINTAAGREFVLLDATTGAADWKETTGTLVGGAVTTVFGRTGNVASAVGDYVASQVNNDSIVAGATVKDALESLLAAIPAAAPVASVHGRIGAVVSVAGDYVASEVTNDSGVAGAFVKNALDSLDSLKVPTGRVLTAGNGLAGGGDLSANRTFDVVALDGSITASPGGIQVGVISDTQHGSRGGGSLHSVATPVSSGFMSFSDKSKLNSIAFGADVSPVTSVFSRVGAVVAVLNDYAASLVDNDSSVPGATVKDALESLASTQVPTARLLTAGAGLTGGGDLSADRTFDIVANGDGSIVVNPDDIQVGILATDAQHGIRGGGTQHALASGASAGFMSPTDKIKLDAIGGGVNSAWQELILDKDLTDPPGGPAPNDRYIVASPATGAWVGKEDRIAQWNGASWDFILPTEGFTAWVADEDFWYTYNGSWAVEFVPRSRTLTAGAGLTGGGDLEANRTFNVAAHADGSIVVNPDDIQVGILATDAQHGARGGGTQHALAVASGLAGFLSGADKQIINDLSTTYAPLTRNLTAGAGLTGGGTLAADRTFNVIANADGSIVVNADDVQVGVLATDAQHGTRGGGTQHALVVPAGAAGFMSGADKSKLDGVATNANNYSHPNHSGDVTSVGDGVQTIANNAVTNAKAAQMAANTVKANPTAGLANASDLVVGANTVLGRVGGNIVAAQLATAQIADNAATNAKIADMAVNTIKGRITAGTGDPEDLTAAQVRTIINVEAGAAAVRLRQTRQVEVTVDTTTTSLTFVTLLTDSITITAGGIIMVQVSIGTSNSNNNITNFFRLVIDGVVRRGSAYTSSGSNNPGSVGLVYRVAGLAAGARTVTLEWRVASGTGQVRPVTVPDDEHATMIIQEATV